MHEHISKRKHSHNDTTINNPEGLESYAVKHIIGRGSRSVVYLATCTRGRLRSRDVALKFIPLPVLPTPAHESLHVATTALHKSLHHPAVIALHSAFTITGYYCLALELCKGGTLCDYLNSRSKPALEHAEDNASESSILTEAQLRPILRSVVEALSYLHARGISHQSISTRNIFLAADGRAKLGGFGRALPDYQLPESEQNHHRTLGGSAFKATEARECSGQTDLTSLGHLVMTLLISIPLSEAEDGTITVTHPSYGSTILPKNSKCSKEAQVLLTALLNQDTLDTQFSFDKILSLPFFQTKQQTQLLNLGSYTPVDTPLAAKELNPKKDKAQPLRTSMNVYIDAQEKSTFSKQKENDQENIIQLRGDRKASGLPYRMPSSVKPIKLVSDQGPSISTYNVPGSRLTSGSSTAASSGIRDAWTKLISRQKLHDRNLPEVMTESAGICIGASDLLQQTNATRRALGEVKNLGSPSDLCEKRVEKHCRDTLSLEKPGTTAPHLTSRSSSLLVPSQHVALTHTPEEIPVPHTNKPTAFKVPPLLPQTHKLAQGQLVVLPSRSVLVDLREGERRTGGRGNRVMCISADGQEISVYDAPHLSTPCILSEPMATWKLSALPSRYWENYIFAAKFVEAVKKRRPRMVWYTPQARFTLMSNGPQGDVHAVFPCPAPESQKHRRRDREAGTFTRIRVVLSRARGSVEVSQFTGEKWLTKVGIHPMGSGEMDLTEKEREALDCVLATLRVCEAAEAQYDSMVPRTKGTSENADGEAQLRVQVGELGMERISCNTAKDSTTTKSLASLAGLALAIGSRPRRIPSTTWSYNRKVSKLVSSPPT